VLVGPLGAVVSELQLGVVGGMSEMPRHLG
jgi:hypothetical protein